MTFDQPSTNSSAPYVFFNLDTDGSGTGPGMAVDDFEILRPGKGEPVTF